MKRRIVVILLALTMVFSLVACGGGGDAGSGGTSGGTQQSGGGSGGGSSSGGSGGGAASGGSAAKVEITAAFSVVANGLCPITEDINTTISLANHFYDRLVELDVDFNWIPGVAKTWKQVDDFNWEFEINTDCVFQNGDKLTMDDVIYSIKRLADQPKSQDVGTLVDSVTANGNILTIKLKEHNNSIMPRLLDFSFIVNKAYMEADTSANKDSQFLKPIGTGPYKVTDFIPGTSIILETWEGYPFEKPQIDKITITPIPENMNRYAAVESGQMQYAGLVSAMEADLATKNNDLILYEGKSNFVIPFGFNCEKAPFDNVNIRRAIIHALDLDSIAKLNGGRNTPRSMLFNGFDNVYVPSPNFPEFNLDKARELLEAEGYTPANPLKMETLYFRPDPGIEYFQSDLKKVGVDLVTNQVEFSVFLTMEGPGQFDGLWTSNPNRGGTWLTDLDRFDYDNFLGMRNLARWRDQRAQDIIAEMRTVTDQQKLKTLSTELNGIIGQQVPIVGVFFMPILSVMTDKLTGVEIKPNMQQSFRNAVYNG